jgi:hypothetical protein
MKLATNHLEFVLSFTNCCVLSVNKREYKLTQQDALLEDLEFGLRQLSFLFQ